MKKTRLISMLCAIAMSLTLVLPVSAANTSETEKEELRQTTQIYTDITLGGTLIRTVDDNSIVAAWVPFDDTDGHTVIIQGEYIYLKGSVIGEIQSTSSSEITTFHILSAGENISWGPWQDFSFRVDTGGLSAAVIATVIAAVAPWVSVKVLAGVAAVIAGKYDYITVSGRMRLGSSTGYDSYYERYTNFYGNGTDPLLDQDIFGSGKEPEMYLYNGLQRLANQ